MALASPHCSLKLNFPNMGKTVAIKNYCDIVFSEHEFPQITAFHERIDRHMTKEQYIQKILDLLQDRTENELIFVFEFLQRIFRL